MTPISVNDGVDTALVSLMAERLSILAGAGLSIPAPSCLPTAAQLAELAKQRYEAIHGPAPFGNDIDSQANYFYKLGQLATVYLRAWIDKDAFAGPPNSGHLAIADLMLTNAISTVVTTNIDTMIESAGQKLYGHIESGVAAENLVQIPQGETPLLKIHGCRQADFAGTIWSSLQLGDPAILQRLQGNSAWLMQRLANRDLLIIGYCTDWDYLNHVLKLVLGNVAPAKVIIVDPSSSAKLAEKAPHLIAIGQKATVTFNHVSCSGDAFLDLLLQKFSLSYVRQILHHGRQDFEALKQTVAKPDWLEPSNLPNDMFRQLRRDLEGCLPRKPAKERRPTAGPALGRTLLQLRAAGAVTDGAAWILDNKRIRVLRAEGKLLHNVKTEFERDTPPLLAPDIVIAVGSEDLALPANIARNTESATVARGSSGKWLTRQQAEAEIFK